MPVKSLLESMGAVVKGEVGDIDIFGLMPDGRTVAVEMKLHLNLDVIIQAVLRQKVADSVYIAVPSPKKSMLRRWHNIGTVLRRLEILHCADKIVYQEGMRIIVRVNVLLPERFGKP